jgi:hypothetical protein
MELMVGAEDRDREWAVVNMDLIDGLRTGTGSGQL